MPLLKRTAEQTRLLKEHPNTLVSIGSVTNVDKKIAAERQKMLDEAAAVRAAKPVEEFIETLSAKCRARRRGLSCSIAAISSNRCKPSPRAN